MKPSHIRAVSLEDLAGHQNCPDAISNISMRQFVKRLSSQHVNISSSKVSELVGLIKERGWNMAL